MRGAKNKYIFIFTKYVRVRCTRARWWRWPYFYMHIGSRAPSAAHRAYFVCGNIVRYVVFTHVSHILSLSDDTCLCRRPRRPHYHTSHPYSLRTSNNNIDFFVGAAGDLPLPFTGELNMTECINLSQREESEKIKWHIRRNSLSVAGFVSSHRVRVRYKLKM